MPKRMHSELMSEDQLAELTQQVRTQLRYELELGIPDVPVKTPSPSSESLDDISADIGDCSRCKLCEGRSNIVFGVGNPNAELMFIGEGPGRDEDLKGEPFVGRAGQLLTRIIQAMGLKRQDVYIANIVKCRPPNNRNPEPDEMATCFPFLQRQIAVVRPKVIVGLGNIAIKTLLQTEQGITRLRGTFQDFNGIPLMPTFHPAFLLRNADKKKEVWEDVQQVMGKLGLELPKPPS